MLTGCRVVDMLDGPSLGNVLRYCGTLQELPAIFRAEGIPEPKPVYRRLSRIGSEAMMRELDRLMRERRSALCVQR